GWASSSMRSPERRTAWSSAIRTLIGDMNARADRRPLTPARPDLERPAQQGDTLLHAVQTQSGCFLERRRCVTPDAVVADHELEHGPITSRDDAPQRCLN